MAYIGPEPNPGQNREVDDISSGFNGNTAAFTLQVNGQNVSPGSANAIIVSLGGVIQNPGTDYTVSASTITFTTNPASGLSFFGLVLGQQIDTEGTADGTITTAKIVDEAVTLAKLPHGTSSNDGKFLRANNGADPTFETVSGTTINNNANNRIITGSSSANTLEGESGLTFDGSTVNLTAASGDARLTLIGTEGNDARLSLVCDDGDDHIDQYNIRSNADDNSLSIDQFESGSFVERVTIENGGNVLLTGAASGGGNVQRVTFLNAGDVLTVRTAGTNNSNHGMIAFRDGGNSFCGQITSNGSSHTTSYGTSSDYRLKENEVLISDGITRLKQLKPYRFKWKSSGETVDGFFAHETQTVVPEAIVGTKDEMQSILYKTGDILPEGKKVGDFKEYSTTEAKYQQIDQSKLVPLLTAALQEAVAKIETLETKVAALEAA
jgi:hypothetical protein